MMRGSLTALPWTIKRIKSYTLYYKWLSAPHFPGLRCGHGLRWLPCLGLAVWSKCWQFQMLPFLPVLLPRRVAQLSRVICQSTNADKGMQSEAIAQVHIPKPNQVLEPHFLCKETLKPGQQAVLSSHVFFLEMRMKVWHHLTKEQQKAGEICVNCLVVHFYQKDLLCVPMRSINFSKQ